MHKLRLSTRLVLGLNNKPSVMCGECREEWGAICRHNVGIVAVLGLAPSVLDCSYFWFVEGVQRPPLQSTPPPELISIESVDAHTTGDGSVGDTKRVQYTKT